MLYRHVFIEEDLCRMLLCLSCNFDSQQFIEFTRAIPSQIISLGSSMLLVEFRADLSSHGLRDGQEFQTVRRAPCADTCSVHSKRSGVQAPLGRDWVRGQSSTLDSVTACFVPALLIDRAGSRHAKQQKAPSARLRLNTAREHLHCTGWLDAKMQCNCLVPEPI